MATFEIEQNGQLYQIQANTQEEALAAFAQYMPQKEAPAAPQEPVSTIADIAKSAGSGLLSGATALASLPSYMGYGLDVAAVKIGLAPKGSAQQMAEMSFTSPQNIAKGVSALTMGAPEYQPKTTGGEYAKKIGEFVPSAAVFGGASPASLLKLGVAPAVAAQTAGDLSEKAGVPSEYRPYVEFAASVLTPSVMNSLQRIGSPFAGADIERLNLAKTLQDYGVKPTAGQTVGSDALRRAEGSVVPSGPQLDQFTAAAMKSTGSNATRALPKNLKAAETSIVNQMDDAVSGLNLKFDINTAQKADDVIKSYMADAPATTVVPRLQNIANAVIDSATGPSNPIALSQLKSWRMGLRPSLISPDPATREAAHAIRDIIDDATAAALQQSGRVDDVAKLATARVQYRNLLAIEDAASKSGELAKVGIIQPHTLDSAVIRTQGRRNYALGTGTTDLAELSRAGAGVLAPMPTVSAGGSRVVEGVGRGAAAAAGATAGSLFGTTGAALGGAAGIAAPETMQMLLRTPAMQKLLARQGTVSPVFNANQLGAPSVGLLGSMTRAQ
jgi:hypothetical protein